MERHLDDLPKPENAWLLLDDTGILACLYKNPAEDSFALSATALSDRHLDLFSQLPWFHQNEIWLKPAVGETVHTFALRGWQTLRTVVQMQLQEPLPNKAGLSLDTYAGEVQAVTALNNLAFSSHPQQGNKEVAYFEQIISAHDFAPEDLLIYREQGIERGFYWSKPTASNSREIYLVALHPQLHGQGLGQKLIQAGLTFPGTEAGSYFLYVEGNNLAALRAYETAGFSRSHTLHLISPPGATLEQ